MRRLVVQQWAAVDNIVAEEDGGLSFVSGEPFDDDVETPFRTSIMSFIDTVDTMVLGANTYAQTKDYWPNATEQGEYGRTLNSLKKVVASSTLDEAPWGDFPAGQVTRDAVATVRELKTQGGKDLWLWGSLTLMRSLMEAGEVDEIRLLVCPVARGTGTRAFDGSADLTLLEATPFETGVVLLRYAVNA